MDLGGWIGYGNWVTVEAGENGHPSRVLCGHGGGMAESFDQCFKAEEVIFNASNSQAFIDDHTLRQKYLPELLAVLAQFRNAPKGYRLPAKESKAFETRCSKPVPAKRLANTNWRQIHEEPLPAGGRRVLLRYKNGAMAWFTVDDKEIATLTSIIEGCDAEDLDVQYRYCFSADEHKQMEATLIPGVDAVAALEKLFGKRLKKLSKYRTQGNWYVADAGIINLQFQSDGKLVSFDLLERGDAYLKVKR